MRRNLASRGNTPIIYTQSDSILSIRMIQDICEYKVGAKCTEASEVKNI